MDGDVQEPRNAKTISLQERATKVRFVAPNKIAHLVQHFQASLIFQSFESHLKVFRESLVDLSSRDSKSLQQAAAELTSRS